MIASKQGTQGWKYLIKDHLGSIRVVFNSSNVADERHGYLAYGDELFTNVFNPSDYLYTGQERDEETDLYNYRARLYDEETGQFYANDPADQFHSPYSYVGGNPLSYTDPTGMFGEALIGALVHYFLGALDNHYGKGMG